ncbi:HSF-type DNA-binding [Seminavis robusta]|uniref:HSF-type DNA-binding n=1 Tax=Seminavis robusta TaxID=568900 RepID=A0A9N8DFQ3_9STRA|nr:HSF-type DNA-binding [Seminavis robusta]|eukprot:Sro67_g037470.1 HSF-type DNA-binding (389) ;mRNA; f:25273-26528
MIANMPCPLTIHSLELPLLEPSSSAPMPWKLRNSMVRGVSPQGEDDDKNVSFPLQLYKMLGQACSDTNNVGGPFEETVSWEPNGTSFAIHDFSKFSTLIMPRYFFISKLSSFHRLLDLHGFSRLQHQSSSGVHQETHTHSLFRRGSPRLLTSLVRRRSIQSKEARRTLVKPTLLSIDQSKTTCFSPSPLLGRPSVASVVSNTSDWESDYSQPEVPDTRVVPASPAPWSSLDVPECELTEAIDFLSDIFPFEDKKAAGLSTVAPRVVPSTLLSQGTNPIKEPKPLSQSLVGKSPPPKLNSTVGPLRTPGRLRNAFGYGMRCVCVHAVGRGRTAKGSVVKQTICMDLTSRNQEEEAERLRFQRPLEISISTEMNHKIWGEELFGPKLVQS